MTKGVKAWEGQELLPCPFCGGESGAWASCDPDEPWRVDSTHSEDCPLYISYFPRCYGTEAEAITEWNTRVNKGPAADAMASALSELIAACDGEVGEVFAGEIGRELYRASQALAAYRGEQS